MVGNPFVMKVQILSVGYAMGAQRGNKKYDFS